MSQQYILAEDGKTPIPETDILKWGRWLAKAERHVAQDSIDGVRVSTVFLGLDHSFCGGPPILWETMVFDGTLDQEQRRYSTYEDAVKGHAEMLAKVLRGETQSPLD